MRNLHSSMLLILGLCVLLLGGCSGNAVRPVPTIEGGIVFDGAPGEAVWDGAAAFDDFRVFRSFERKAPLAASVRMLTDGEYLWVALRCEDGGAAHARRLARAEGADDKRLPESLGRDSVGFMLDPQFGFASLAQWHVSEGGEGSRKLGLRGEAYAGRSIEYDYKTSVDETGWSAEARIPLAGTGLLWHAAKAERDVTFRINAIRNLRLPADAEGQSGRFVLANTIWGYWDQREYSPAFVSSDDRRVTVSMPESGVLRNVAGVPLTIDNRSGERQSLTVAWFDESGEAIVRSDVALGAGDDYSAALPVEEFGQGRWTRWVRVDCDGRPIYERPFVVEYDRPVTILDNFPHVSDGPARREVRFVVPEYVGSLEGVRLDVTVQRPGGSGQRALDVDLNPKRREASLRFEPIFAELDGGSWRIAATLMRGDELVGGNILSFVKGRTPVPATLVLPQGTFEVLGGEPMKAWVDIDHPGLEGDYPAGWKLGKQARFLKWADPRTVEDAVYEGEHTLHAHGYGIGGQCHILSDFFDVDLSKRYRLTFMAKGRGIVRAQFYTKNKENEWLNEYFRSEWFELTGEWRRYEMPPIDFDVEVARTWSRTEPKSKKPHHVRLCIFPKHDGALFLDNVFLWTVEKGQTDE